MKRLSNYWSGLSSPTLLLLLALMLMAGCSGTPLSLLTGGGPNVAANTQLGETNQQVLGTSETTKVDVKDVQGTVQVSNDNNEVSTDSGSVIVNKTEIDPLLLILLVLGWLLPSPQEIARGFINIFKRKQ
jgi:hypothetical protein